MPFRWRPMRAADAAACADVVATHPIIGPRYGPASRHLERVWRRLLSSEGMTTAVYEELTPNGIAFAGFGVGVFVSDQFVLELKAAPQFWFGPVLCSRIVNGHSPVLSDREVRVANSVEGLNELVWEALASPGFADRSELFHLMGSAYVDIHRGYQFKEMITAQADSPERLQWGIDAGGLLWDPSSGAYVRSAKGDITKIVRTPHIVGITREIELSRPGSWVGSLFDYDPPRIDFSNGEQRMLKHALTDRAYTNETLARALGISRPR